MTRRDFIAGATLAAVLPRATLAQGHPMTPQPFAIAVADDVLADLEARLRLTRWPDAIPGAG